MQNKEAGVLVYNSHQSLVRVSPWGANSMAHTTCTQESKVSSTEKEMAAHETSLICTEGIGCQEIVSIS